jgi:HEPN domain-containing protein
MVQAKHDFAVAKQLHRAGHYDWACFCAQQAAEKAVKALLFVLGASPPTKGVKGHATGEMLASFPQVLDDTTLNRAAVALVQHEQSSRYPSTTKTGTLQAPTHLYVKLDADRAVENAAILLGFCDWAVGRVEAVWSAARAEIPKLVAAAKSATP